MLVLSSMKLMALWMIPPYTVAGLPVKSAEDCGAVDVSAASADFAAAAAIPILA